MYTWFIISIYVYSHENVLRLFHFDFVVNVSESIFFVTGEYFRKILRYVFVSILN